MRSPGASWKSVAVTSHRPLAISRRRPLHATVGAQNRPFDGHPNLLRGFFHRKFARIATAKAVSKPAQISGRIRKAHAVRVGNEATVRYSATAIGLLEAARFTVACRRPRTRRCEGQNCARAAAGGRSPDRPRSLPVSRFARSPCQASAGALVAQQ